VNRLESRTCTVSLGIGQISACNAVDQPTSWTGAVREYPLVTLSNCTLIARRSSPVTARSLQGMARARFGQAHA
jgi:hypothetical protein